jgi:hypothetical protein
VLTVINDIQTVETVSRVISDEVLSILTNFSAPFSVHISPILLLIRSYFAIFHTNSEFSNKEVPIFTFGTEINVTELSGDAMWLPAFLSLFFDDPVFLAYTTFSSRMVALITVMDRGITGITSMVGFVEVVTLCASQTIESVGKVSLDTLIDCIRPVANFSLDQVLLNQLTDEAVRVLALSTGCVLGPNFWDNRDAMITLGNATIFACGSSGVISILTNSTFWGVVIHQNTMIDERESTHVIWAIVSVV